MLDSNGKLINKECRIENTNACNAHCTICPREKMTRPKAYMPQGHFENLVDQAQELGAELISVFGYGEPLLDKKIVNKIKYCSRKGLDTFITTNASLLKIDLSFALLNAGLSKIRFSVHGSGENYERVQKGLKYDEVRRNVSNFAAINKTRFANQCEVSITIIPLNDESIEDLQAAWKGFDIEVWRPHNWGKAKHYRGIAQRRKKTCGRPHSGPVQIQADGKVIPCCFLTNAEMVMGDTYKQSLKKILQGPKYKALRKRHETGDMRGVPCETCDQLNVGDDPLLFSTIDPSRATGKTSSTKFKLEEN